MDQLIIREAKVEDKQDILDIRDIYDGMDYLREYFDYFMTDPNITSYVAVIADQIVGFVAAHVVDEGATVVTRAARTRSTFSGKGIYSSLTSHIIKMTTAKTVAFTSTSLDVFDKTSFKNVHRQILLRKRICLEVDLHALNLPVPSLTEGYLTTPSADEQAHMMSSTSYKEYLFPNDRIVVHWVPYKLLPSNIPFFSHNGAVTRIAANVLNDIGARKGLLSISKLHKCRKPMFYSILDIYGTDLSCLKDHILFHLRKMHEVTDSEIAMRIYIEPSLDGNYAVQTVKDIGVAQCYLDPKDDYLVFERDA